MKNDFLKLFALFTVIRLYNLIVLVFALYLTAFFIFSDSNNLNAFIKNDSLNYLVLANVLTIAGGYIINNFYDNQKDKVGRPLTTYIAQWISQPFKLRTYVILNSASLLFAFLVSWRVGIFIIVFQFLIWFYSHKLNKVLFLNNLTSILLALFPFLALMLYFDNYSILIFKLALLTGMLLFLTDLCKDLSTYTADLVFNYKTLPVVLGINRAKIIITLFTIFGILLAFDLAFNNDIHAMRAYIIGLIPAFVIFVIGLWAFNSNKTYMTLVIFLRVLTGLGVLSIIGMQYLLKDLIAFFN